MKIKINKKLLIGLFLIFFFCTSIVFAASSSDFYTKAKKYIDNNCSKGSPSNETSLNCYLFYKAGELEAMVNSNTSRISALESVPTPTPLPSPLPQKELKTFDNSGNELGLYIDRSSFFYVPLGKIVVLSDAQISSFTVGITRDDIWFQDSSCTGQAYGVFSDRDYWSKSSEIVSGGPGKYYTVDKGPGILASTGTLSLSSLQRYSGGIFTCHPSSFDYKAWSLTPVTLPFSEPIELPLQFKYQ